MSQLVKALGGASFAPGLSESAAPGRVAAVAGVEDTGAAWLGGSQDGCTKVVLNP